MRKRVLGAVLGALVLSGCSTPGGWQGVAAEKTYDKILEARRQGELYNNDDYYEIHTDARIYAFSDFKDYDQFRKTGEVPLVVTQIGSGPNGETVRLQLNKKEASAMEKTVGYKGAAQRMYEGDLKGIDPGFYAEVVTPNRYFVFSSWDDLVSYRMTGEVPCGITNIGGGPESRTVVFVQSCKAAAAGKPDQAMARFKTNYGIN